MNLSNSLTYFTKTISLNCGTLGTMGHQNIDIYNVFEYALIKIRKNIEIISSHCHNDDYILCVQIGRQNNVQRIKEDKN